MAITFTETQADVYDSANPSVPTLGSTPTEGNLLICIAGERSGSSHTAFVDPSGWTKVLGHDNEIADSSARLCIAIWIKKAGAGESTSVSIDNGTANTIGAALIELTPSESIDDFVVPSGGTTSAGTGTGSTSPLGTGSTSSLSAADYLILAVGVHRRADTTIDHAPSFSGTEDLSGVFGNTTANSVSIYWEVHDDATSGTKSDTLSWSNSGHEGVAALAAIEAQTGGGGGTWPHNPLGHPIKGPFGGPVS